MIFQEQARIAVGLQSLLQTTQSYSKTLPEKLNAMESIYLQHNPTMYNTIEKKRLQYFREAFTYKFYIATMHLEQLWALTHSRESDISLEQILSNILDDHQTSNAELLLYSFAFEGFIVEGNSFLDFYMLYLCFIFQFKRTERLSGKKFLAALQGVQEPSLQIQAVKVKTYFEQNVFGEGNKQVFLVNNWGQLLRDLRNSLLHRDCLMPSFDYEETLLGKLLVKWPVGLWETSTSRFCQDLQNVMFAMVTELASVVYSLEWKPGPLMADLWA